MYLEHLCDFELAYRQTPILDSTYVIVQPYNTEEGTGYGEGDGKAFGPKLNGKVRFVNHPHRRSDGTMLPDAHGVLLTDDGAILLFHIEGRTTFMGDRGKQLLLVLFETEAEHYKWLNTALCVLEGVIEAPLMRMRGYVCIQELV